MTISLNEMSSLARALVQADEDIKEAEKNLSSAKEYARTLREETIPGAMQEIGVESLKLETGETISVKQEVYASIPKAGKEDAFNWLNENGFGGLIKVSVDASFGKGDQEKALELYKELQDKGMDVVIGQDVHAQTLRAFLREQLAKASNIPLDLFGARPVWVAKISSK